MVEKIIQASLDRIELDIAVVYSNDDSDDDVHHKYDIPFELVNGAKP